MHKVSIRSDKNGKTQLLIDGIDLSAGCRKICLEQNGGEFPNLTLTLDCDDLTVELERSGIETK